MSHLFSSCFLSDKEKVFVALFFLSHLQILADRISSKMVVGYLMLHIKALSYFMKGERYLWEEKKKDKTDP